jgi:uncharacterized membrane protein YphA (DoxX/SURF4 family)
VLHAVAAVAWLRIFSSFGWLQSAFVGKDAKIAPDFLNGTGLATAIQTRFAHTALTPGIADFLTSFVLPHAFVFAILIALADTFAGLSLLTGFLTRVGGTVAVLRSISNICVAGVASAADLGFNEMLIVAGVICVVCAAGRVLGFDKRLVATSRPGDRVRIVA